MLWSNLKKVAFKSFRVFEYTNQDGQTFWSFERLPAVTTGHQLRLEDRVGTQFEQYINQLRLLRRTLENQDDD